MTEETFPFILDTIGKMIDSGSRLWVHCNNHGCWNRQEIDLEALAARKGRDFGCSHWDLIKVFYCAPCRDAGLQDRNINFTHNPRSTRGL